MENTPVRWVSRFSGVGTDAVYRRSDMPGGQGIPGTRQGSGGTVKNGKSILVLLPLDGVLGQATQLGISLGVEPAGNPVSDEGLDARHSRCDGHQRV